MTNTRLSNLKPSSLTLAVEEKSEDEIEREPISGSYPCDSEPEDNEAYIEYPDGYSLDVLALAMKQDKAALDQLNRLLNDLKEYKHDAAVIREKFSVQCQSEEYAGTNAVWWLAKGDQRAALLLYKFYQRYNIVTREQFAATCQGTKFTGTNAFFWIAYRAGEGHTHFLNGMIKDSFVTPVQLEAQYIGIEDDEPKLKQYRGFTGAELLVTDMLQRNAVSHFLILLENERINQSQTQIITANLFSERISYIVNKYLNEKNATINSVKEFILALHMILCVDGRSLVKNHLGSLALRIIQEFDNHMIDLLASLLQSPIGNKETALRHLEGNFLKDILLDKILFMRDKPTHWLFKGKPTFLLEYTMYICKLKFFKSYLKKQIFPLAEKKILADAILSFVERTGKLLKEVVLNSLPDDQSETVLTHYRKTMQLGLENYFAVHPECIMSRESQKDISAHTMAQFSKGASADIKLFTPKLVQDILEQILMPAKNSEYKI